MKYDLFSSLESFACKTLNATFPFPQVFGLRRLRGNPPCSLWLQSVHWTNCFTRRAHITVPPCKGTHGDRVAGDNTRSRHNLRHFSYCATSLCAPATQQQGAVACTLVKSDARYGRRLAAPIPSFKLHIPFISTLRISFNFGRNPKLCHCEPTCSAWQSRGNETTNFFCAVPQLFIKTATLSVHFGKIKWRFCYFFTFYKHCSLLRLLPLCKENSSLQKRISLPFPSLRRQALLRFQ